MNYHPEKTLMVCLATFLFLIALMGAYLKYAEAVESGTEGAPALLYMLVMFFVIFIVAGSVTVLLVGVLTPMATHGIMRLLSVHHRTSLPEGEEVAPVNASLQHPQAEDEIHMVHQQALKERNAQSLQQQTRRNPAERETGVGGNLCLYTRYVPKGIHPNPNRHAHSEHPGTLSRKQGAGRRSENIQLQRGGERKRFPLLQL